MITLDAIIEHNSRALLLACRCSATRDWRILMLETALTLIPYARRGTVRVAIFREIERTLTTDFHNAGSRSLTRRLVEAFLSYCLWTGQRYGRIMLANGYYLACECQQADWHYTGPSLLILEHFADVPPGYPVPSGQWRIIGQLRHTTDARLPAES
jgi:hypothetical protein